MQFKTFHWKSYKAMVIPFILCFVFGIISANLVGNLWSAFYVEKFKYGQTLSPQLFFFLLESRLPIFLLILALSLTSPGLITLFLYLGWQVFSVGFLLASAIASYGFKGIILVITATFPHYLIYIPVYILCFFLAKTTYKRKRGERKYPIYLLLATALTLLYLLGIFLESYVNPRILTRILYFF